MSQRTASSPLVLFAAAAVGDKYSSRIRQTSENAILERQSGAAGLLLFRDKRSCPLWAVLRNYAMRWLAWIACGGLACCALGCGLNPAPAPPAPGMILPVTENPVRLPGVDREYLWNLLVDVVDDYFTIEQEEPVRLVQSNGGEVLTEGRIDTFPEGGSTWFEPWRSDSANSYEKTESTLQSIRRQAVIRVVPSEDGYLVDIAVFKELEDVARPDYATTGGATFRNDSSLERGNLNVVGQRMTTRGWIPLGRDAALEQQMIGQLRARLAPTAPAYSLPPANYTPTRLY